MPRKLFVYRRAIPLYICLNVFGMRYKKKLDLDLFFPFFLIMPDTWSHKPHIEVHCKKWQCSILPRSQLRSEFEVILTADQWFKTVYSLQHNSSRLQSSHCNTFKLRTAEFKYSTRLSFKTPQHLSADPRQATTLNKIKQTKPSEENQRWYTSCGMKALMVFLWC